MKCIKVSHGNTEGTEVFKALATPFFVSFVISVRSKTGWEVQSVSHRGSEGTEVFKALATPLSLAFEDSVRGRISHGGFSTLFLLPLRVLCGLREIQNGMGGTKCFAQRLRGHRGF